MLLKQPGIQNILERFPLPDSLQDYLCDDVWDAISIDDPRMEDLIDAMNVSIFRMSPRFTHVDQLRGKAARIAARISFDMKRTGALKMFTAPERVLLAHAILKGTERTIQMLANDQEELYWQPISDRCIALF